MTREARVRVVQVLANIARWRKILPAIDRLCNHWPDITELQMLRMAEMREQRLRRLGNRDILMAGPADRQRRQVVVLDAGAVYDGCMTIRAIRFQLQMHAMGKWRCRGR